MFTHPTVVLTAVLAAVASAMPAATPTSSGAPEPTESTGVKDFLDYTIGEATQLVHNVPGSLLPLAANWECTKKGQSKKGADKDNGKGGLKIKNGDKAKRSFYLYHNSCDQVPWKYMELEAGKEGFFQLPLGFEGRVQRGTDAELLAGNAQTVATWFEITLDNNNVMWGDVSLIRGNDGPLKIWSDDDSKATKGFEKSNLDGAPKEAYFTKPVSKAKVINAVYDKNNQYIKAVQDWNMKIGPDNVYVDDSNGNPVIASQNGRMSGTFFAGRP